MIKVFCLHFIVLFTFLAPVTVMAENNGEFDIHAAQVYHSKWHVLEDVFITQPRNSIYQAPKLPCIALFAAACGTGAFLLSKKGIQAFSQGPDGVPTYPYVHRKQNYLAGLTGIGLGAFAFSKVCAYLLDYEERKQMENYMRNWPNSKELLPSELHGTFERLAHQYRDKNPHYHENCGKTIRLVKNAVYERFQHKYAAKKWTDFFNETRFNVNVHFDLVQAIEKLYTFIRRHVI